MDYTFQKAFANVGTGPGIGFVPVPTVFPTTNATTTSKPVPTEAGLSCEASCLVRYPELYGLSWAREDEVVFTETVVVATVSIGTTTMGNDTSVGTRTVWNNEAEIPRYHTLYHVSTDEAGTKVVEAGITLSDGYTYTTFTYPTPFVDYPSAYHWEGILATFGNDEKEICATSTEELAFGEVTPHPLYPQPTNFPDKSDPEGMNYVPVWIALQELPDKKWFDNTFPSESAFVYCESVAGKPPPDVISTAKFVLTTATFQTSRQNPGFVHTESAESTWEETPTKGPPGLVDTTNNPDPAQVESTTAGLPMSSKTSTPTRSSSVEVPEIPIIVTTMPPWDTRPSARPTPPLVQNPSTVPVIRPGGNRPGATPGNENGEQTAPTNNNGPGQSIPVVNNPGRQSAGAPAPTTPIFTFVPTTINGRPTAVPVFVLPGSSSTATIGQTVTFGGRTTILQAPTAIFAIVPTTVNGLATSTPAFIISGTSTASIGQTVTIDGQPTVLTAPAPFATEIATSIFGIETHVTAFIISGSITAFPGQTVTLDGQVTALPTADAVFITITTTVDGRETVIPAYIISGSVTATIGQTVTIDGSTTVLSTPTADVALTSITTTINGKQTVIPVYIISGSLTATLGQTATIDGTKMVLPTPTETDASAASFPTDSRGQPRETGSTKGGGDRRRIVSCNTSLIGVGALLLMWL